MKRHLLIIPIFMAIMIQGCAGDKASITSMDTNAPTVVKSVDDLPLPSTSIQEITKSGVIRVIEESAEAQAQYNALKSARTLAQVKLLEMVDGVRIAADMEVKIGTLKEDSVKKLVEGKIRTFDCGAYYDKVKQIGYYCMEVPVR